MDVLNKLKSTVSTTVSQLSGVLPGNPVTREYDVVKQIGSAGPGLLWKIYSSHKKSTKQEAAVFVLEKKSLDRLSKKDKDNFLELSRKGVAQLTRLRHPQILTVQHPLEESRESLAFATEPVFSSLANVLGNHENLPPAVASSLKDYRLFDVEIKYGLQQLAEGLTFLHNDAKLLHANICPESVIVNSQGAWKIFGFDFCVAGENSADGKVFWNMKEPETEVTYLAQPNLDYLAPEVGQGKRFGGNSVLVPVSPSLDMFSLGCLIYSVFNKGSVPLPMEGDVERYFKHSTTYRELPFKGMDSVPADLLETVRSLLQSVPDKRTDAYHFLKISYFEDVGVKTLNYLDSLFQWDNLQKSQFFKGLPSVLAKLPHRLCLHRVIPCLAKEFVNPSMVPFVLPCALHVAQEASKDDYVSLILPYLKPVMKLQEPIQILLIFMQKMELLLQKTPPDDVKSDVLPMIYRALEVEASPQIQELCLSIIPNFANLIDYPAMKNALIPRIKKLCVGSSLLSVRVNCLLCLGKLLDHVDKWLVLDDVLPMLQKIPSKEPAVLMGIVGIYKIAFEHPKLGIPKEVLATQIIPFLFPLIVEPGLGLTQFRALMSLLKEMIQRVEEEQRTKLENLAALQEEQHTSLQSTLSGFTSTKTDVSERAANGSHATPVSTSGLKVETSEQSSGRMAPASSNLAPKPLTANQSPAFIMQQPIRPTHPQLLTNSVPKSESLDQLSKLTSPSSNYMPRSQSTNHNAALTMQQPMRPIQPQKPTNGDSLMNSIMESNLSAMKINPAARPPPPLQQSTQWSPAPAWGTSPAPALAQQQLMQPLMPSVPIRPNVASQFVMPPMMNQGAQSTSVKPLARSDIDDLLS